jgi:hypothetical protein
MGLDLIVIPNIVLSRGDGPIHTTVIVIEQPPSPTIIILSFVMFDRWKHLFCIGMDGRISTLDRHRSVIKKFQDQ